MDLDQIKAGVDGAIDALWPALEAKQEAYLAKNGRYFQKVMSDPVIDGAAKVPNFDAPTDEKAPEDSEIVIEDALPFQIGISEWVAPDGAGWSATANIELSNGDIHTRTKDNQGNDTGWSLIEDDLI